MRSGSRVAVGVAGKLTQLRDILDAVTGPSREIDSACARLAGWHRVDPRFAKNRKGVWITSEEFIGTNSDGSPRLGGDSDRKGDGR